VRSPSNFRHNNICLFKRICHPGFQFSGEAVHPLAQKHPRRGDWWQLELPFDDPT